MDAPIRIDLFGVRKNSLNGLAKSLVFKGFSPLSFLDLISPNTSLGAVSSMVATPSEKVSNPLKMRALVVVSS